MFNFGAIEVLEQQGLTKFPQKAAFDGRLQTYGLCRQSASGVNHIFLARRLFLKNLSVISLP